MIGIVDYGMGNLKSVRKAVERLNVPCEYVTQPEQVRAADRIILPGVGAFEDAIAALRKNHLDEAILEKIHAGVPFLGICLGMHMLFDRSFENGEFAGLGVFHGDVRKFDFQGIVTSGKLSVPHMGWNQISLEQPEHPFWKGMTPGTFFYFVHSYHVVPRDASILACQTDYGYPFCSAVTKDNVVATQFHPEKSQDNGRVLLENFLKM
ncbi:MAG: imidazole glycerol phosphate synthase subunit HisH [Planctomycetia bacterium]|nr:imidazole glycerol phosphate synthase subunit HisH [Planctomycetia bacterium]